MRCIFLSKRRETCHFKNGLLHSMHIWSIFASIGTCCGMWEACVLINGHKNPLAHLLHFLVNFLGGKDFAKPSLPHYSITPFLCIMIILSGDFWPLPFWKTSCILFTHMLELHHSGWAWISPYLKSCLYCKATRLSSACVCLAWYSNQAMAMNL